MASGRPSARRRRSPFGGPSLVLRDPKPGDSERCFGFSAVAYYAAGAVLALSFAARRSGAGGFA